MKALARVSALAMGTLLSFNAAIGFAQQPYYSRPISFILPVPPGGALDVFARALTKGFQDRTGGQIIIENRPGANFIIAGNACARARPDGYTMCMLLRDNISISPLIEKIPYDPDKDLAPVTNMVYLRNLMVAHPSVPAKNFKELVEYSKKNPDALNYSAFGSSQMLVEWIKKETGAKMTFIAYKGAGDAFKDFLGGRLQVIYLALSTPTLVADINSGKMTGLVVQSDKRIPQLPNVPSFVEVGLPDLAFRNWLGLFVPSATPKDHIAKLSADISGVIRSREFIDKYLAPAGYDPIGGTPEEFASFLQRDRKVGEMLAKLAPRIR